ncbi:MAG: twin-arginine translocase TatA/TatE family subunit [Thermoleophilia bacterium]|nr:twin-arginine translocase TatA/TatE family subunit [Thermoleophilia bacterium]
MPGFIGATELIMLALVALLVFGPKRLPEMGRSLGRGLREFKDSVSTSPSAATVIDGHVATSSTTDVDENPFEEAERLTADRATARSAEA